mmetsp:Transcript_27649/g.60950  ORF Transcript_27649/g.60950 Transcript_27649/m.60950 type:complete len:318 (+) Transcript_27649:140-1093(+)
MCVAVAVHAIHELLSSLDVKHAEGPTHERRKANAEYSADVSISGGSDDSVLQTEGSLVNESGNTSHLHVFHTDVLGGVSLADLGQHRNNLGVQLLGRALLGILRVQVETLSGLAAQETLLEHRLHDLGAAAEHPVAEVGSLHESANVRGDVYSYLVAQGDGPNGHTKIFQRFVEGQEVGAVIHQSGHLSHERGQAAVDIEAGDVLDEDAGLALAGAHLHGRGGDVGGGPLVQDDLQKRHHGHRGEVVHADHALGSLGPLGDLRDRDGRGVAREDAVGRGDGLHLLHHLVLHVNVFEHRLDHHVGLGEVLLPGRVAVV